LDREEASFEERGALKLGHIGQSLHNSVQNGPPDLRVGHLATTELDREFHPVAPGEELVGLANLGLQVGIPDLGGTAKLLQVGSLLALAGVLLLFLGLVLELAVVEVLADRGCRGGGDLYKV
jgi:hypothetical protein